MSAKHIYETQRIDHLGIVAGICQGTSLIEKKEQSNRVMDSTGFANCSERFVSDKLNQGLVEYRIKPQMYSAFTNRPRYYPIRSYAGCTLDSADFFVIDTKGGLR